MAHLKIASGAWVVVCDGAKSLILENAGDAENLNLKTLESAVQFDPPTREQGTDRPGRVFQSYGAARSAVSATDLHSEAEAEFLAALAKHLDDAVRNHSVHHILLVAPPRALGLLRKHLTPALQAVIQAEVAKDLIHLPTYEIEKHLTA